MLVAPTEPRAFDSLGLRSPIPESYGADFLLTVNSRLIGIQRKEYADLIASVQGDRVYRELLLMKGLSLGIWLIEGRPQWTSDGSLISNGSWTHRHETGFICSIQQRGHWIVWQDSIQGSIAYLSYLSECLGRELGESSLSRRPMPTGEWGRLTNREWAMHVLMSWPGVGAKSAASIMDGIGRLPLRWDCTREELVKVAGRKKGEKMWRSLDGET